VKPYIFYGSKYIEIMGMKDGQPCITESRVLGTEIVICEPEDIVDAKINLETKRPSGRMEVWNIWELGSREIVIPGGCKDCQMRDKGCLDKCPCR
jgi:hypothetical protein